ncbi:MAG: TonB-dependent receptor, partial [Myxococcales bacterium]|nr:TonB-dependent receptor [Myxococcales bacterium]
SAFGVAAGPRASVTLSPLPWLKVLAAYGQGFRSPQARQLQDGETAPFTKVHSGDLGTRLFLGPHSELELTLAGFITTLSDDVAFEPAEARLERIGPTQRMGGVFYGTLRPWSWFLASASVTYVHATLEGAPPATADNPSPPFEDGQLLPYVPPWVVRIDSRIEQPVAEIDGTDLSLAAGFGFSFLSERPLPYGQLAPSFAQVDTSAGARWRMLELTIEAYNLFDVQYAASEYSFVSDWDVGNPPSRLPARHFSAGAPFTLLASLGVRL